MLIYHMNDFKLSMCRLAFFLLLLKWSFLYVNFYLLMESFLWDGRHEHSFIGAFRYLLISS